MCALAIVLHFIALATWNNSNGPFKELLLECSRKYAQNASKSLIFFFLVHLLLINASLFFSIFGVNKKFNCMRSCDSLKENINLEKNKNLIEINFGTCNNLAGLKFIVGQLLMFDSFIEVISVEFFNFPHKIYLAKKKTFNAIAFFLLESKCYLQNSRWHEK